jgi:hypothetical protein
MDVPAGIVTIDLVHQLIRRRRPAGIPGELPASLSDVFRQLRAATFREPVLQDDRQCCCSSGVSRSIASSTSPKGIRSSAVPITDLL